MSAVAEHALEYAANGLPVLPIAPDCRTPLYKGGSANASADRERVAAWWRGRPDACVGLACGPVAGMFALDVDCKAADGFASLAALERDHGPLPPTWTVATPSGGAHLYFAHPTRALRNRVGFRPGLDVRAAGGWCAAPPSTRGGVAYVWRPAPWDVALADAPAWLVDVIAPPEPARRSRQPIRIACSDRAARYVAGAVNRECASVASCGVGGRNLRLFQAAANLGEFVGAGLLPRDMAADALERAAEACGLIAGDGAGAVRATIASGLKRGAANPRTVAA